MADIKDHSLRLGQSYSDEETKRRFEAALRGARAVGHEPMKDIPPKRRSGMKAGKLKAKTGVDASRSVRST